MPEKKRADKALELEKIRKAVAAACRASGAFRDCIPVFGEGPAESPLMVVGEAPGRDETRLGRPFVGKAGKFLISVLRETLGAEREDIYITNVVKVWPKLETARLKTRKPVRDEEEFFRPFLEKEIRVLGPKVILAVGKVAYSALVPEGEFVPGRWDKTLSGVLVMPVYHPSYILRRQKSLRENTEELKSALRVVKRRLSGLD